jgi:hypothetical protein
MKTLLHPLFLVGSITALFVYSNQWFQLPYPDWISFYVNDFLCMPLVLLFILAVLRYFKKKEDYQIPFLFIISLTLYYSWFFEAYLPRHNGRYTSDPIDVVLYFCGSFLFYTVQKRDWI